MDDDSIFKLEKNSNQPYEGGEDFVVMDITIEMNLDQGILARTGYTFLDVLSDVGGIQSLVASAITFWLGAWNYKHFDNFMAAALFKVKREPNASQKDGTKMIRPTSYCNILEFFIDMIPIFCFCKGCSSKSVRMRRIEKARREMAKEINIVEIIKSRRMISRALELLLPESKLKELKESTEYFNIYSDDAFS